MDTPDATALWEDLAGEAASDPAVSRSTMMGLPCLRVDGTFYASLTRDEPALVVKLPAGRVDELIAAGDAAPFAPAGRRFKEWAKILAVDEATWQRHLSQARAFVAEG